MAYSDLFYVLVAITINLEYLNSNATGISNDNGLENMNANIEKCSGIVNLTTTE
jgi:hypothetical protein